jgi:hypothetical protein
VIDGALLLLAVEYVLGAFVELGYALGREHPFDAAMRKHYALWVLVLDVLLSVLLWPYVVLRDFDR